ncbi:MAG: homocysteine S-methyltransferase family protein [Clostridia bacterium]|nr:homocysteine S-methyltransferase family protein [Clostridia bacterium]
MRKQNVTIMDGAMGTMLQSAGLKAGERPEILSITHPELIEEIHRAYIAAGSEMVLTNTFCANAHKLAGQGYSVKEVVTASVGAARRACTGTGTKVLLDIGPVGELLAPIGTLSFDEAYALFKEMLTAGEAAGADGVLFETFSDLAEIRIGILAAKECTALPVFATMTFEADGRTFLGCDAGAAAMTLSGLGVEALGINCSLGPVEALQVLKRMRRYTDLPLILKPNAGLPDPETGLYRLDAAGFAAQMAGFATLGAAYVGGCCGTTPAFIEALCGIAKGKSVSWETGAVRGICSPGRIVEFDGDIHPIGERINPTGKSAFAKTLLDGDTSEAEKRAVTQEEAGAQILDINVGVPGIDEPAMMRAVVMAVSGISMLPLQIDSSNPEALEAGLRAAPGKCLINSVNASEESLKRVLPLAKKYGAAVVGLTLDGRRIPETVEERLVYAKRILDAAVDAGIRREDVAIDCLTMTVSAQQKQAAMTLTALRQLHDEWQVQTVLGVSNISFGLPERQLVTETFLAQALASGLTLPIVNPNQTGIMGTIDAARILLGYDAGCAAYVERHAGAPAPVQEKAAGGTGTIEEAILRGQADTAVQMTRQALQDTAPLVLAETVLMPALDKVGQRYEAKQIFLPQLINAASAAGAAFDEIRAHIAGQGENTEKKGPIILATVEGDIHDIGKNIVKTVLENYGYAVIDLGKDVKPETICERTVQSGARLVGLSALMTTTVPAMERTIRMLHERGINVPTVVGGAVLTEDFARRIGADYYAKDAKASADIARQVIG